MANIDTSSAPVRSAPSPHDPSPSIDGVLERLQDLVRRQDSDLSDKLFGARSPAGELLEDAEQIAYELLEESARFREEALSDAEQLRVQGEREGASLVDEARATADRLRAEGERDRANLLDQARVEADHVRARAEADSTALVRAARQQAQDLAAEAQHDTAALLQGASAEAGRLRAEGQDERAALLDAAHAEAERLRAEGRDEATAFLDAARAQAERVRQQAADQASTLLAKCQTEADEIRTAADRTAGSMRPAITPMHSSEISARQFPRSWRGLDPAPVQKWLSLVESSQATLEDEVDRLQAAWDDAVDCLARLKMRLASLQTGQGNPRSDLELEHARDEWEQAARALAAGARSRPTRSTFESLLVRHAMLEAPIRRQVFGYSKAEVDRLLASSAAQVARLENRASILTAENHQLRERLLAQASWRLPIQPGEPPAQSDAMRSLPQASGPAGVGPDDHGSPRR